MTSDLNVSKIYGFYFLETKKQTNTLSKQDQLLINEIKSKMLELEFADSFEVILVPSDTNHEEQELIQALQNNDEVMYNVR